MEIVLTPAATGEGTYDISGEYLDEHLHQKTADGWNIYTGSGSALVVSDDNPGLVRMSRMWAESRGRAIVVGWETASEFGTAGFQILRSQDRGEFQLMTPDIIPAQGGATIPAVYLWTDFDAAAGHDYRYMIVEVEDSGNMNEFGPVSASVSRQPGRRR